MRNRKSRSSSAARSLAAAIGAAAFLATGTPAWSRDGASNGRVRTALSKDVSTPRVPVLFPARDADRVGDPEFDAVARKALSDTVWIADWTFDSPGGACREQGWTKIDNRILNDGAMYWSIRAGYGAPGNKAAVLGKHDVCWATPDGYGNNWDQSIRLTYQGTTTLSFNYLLDTELADEMLVEADSAGQSFALAAASPWTMPQQYRTVLFRDSRRPGLAGQIDGLVLPDFGAPLVFNHLYIRFKSNDLISPQTTSNWGGLGAGLVVDNLVVQGGLNYSESFEGALSANLVLMNSAPVAPFGQWARLYPHITDNDKCTENTTCAWLFSDPARIAYRPDMAFGPGQAVIHNWLDNIIQSPWVSLATTPAATGTLLSCRVFGGNYFERGRIMLNMSVRARLACDVQGNVGEGPWDNPWWWTNNSFTWRTHVEDLTPWLSPFFEGQNSAPMTDIQVRLRVSDWQYLSGWYPPVTLNTGPGPYLDRVRIGRIVSNGPWIRLDPDTRVLAQDGFATQPRAAAEHFVPSNDRFGTGAFTSADDLGQGWAWNAIDGDSIVLQTMWQQGREVTNVALYAWIVVGPHAGKAPAPYAVNPQSGAFVVPAEHCQIGDVILLDKWFVDMDDTYLRGGDVVHYLWLAQDIANQFASYPPGLTAPPVSRSDAESRLGGLLEVSCLPKIAWDPGYLGRIAADANGDLDPTSAELANSHQASCMLYVQQVNRERHTGDANRTSFMYTLDRLGYRNHYDVYDDQGVNTDLGSRASVAQATGYALIIQDCGRFGSFGDGSDPLWAKINQAQWYRNYLASGSVSEAGRAGLWLIGESAVGIRNGNPLLTTDMGVVASTFDQSLAVSPDVTGVANATFLQNCQAPFLADRFSLSGGCPQIRSYDGLSASGSGVVTHRFAAGLTVGFGAVVANYNPANGFSTVAMSFGWFDVVTRRNLSPSNPAMSLASKVLGCMLPAGCIQSLNPSEAGEPDATAVPAATSLHPNIPNPFNPTTVIPFDLAHESPVRLDVFDVAGRAVKRLVDTRLPAGRHRHTWNGLDAAGVPVATGVYLVRLTTDDGVMTRRIVAVH